MAITTNLEQLELPEADHSTGLYCIYDRVAEESGPVFAAKNDGVAVRACVNMMIRDGVLNIDDYDLHKVAVYNTRTLTMKEDIRCIDMHATYYSVKERMDIEEVKKAKTLREAENG